MNKITRFGSVSHNEPLVKEEGYWGICHGIVNHIQARLATQEHITKYLELRQVAPLLVQFSSKLMK